MQVGNDMPNFRLRYGKISQTGPRPDYVPRKTRTVKVLSGLSDDFAHDELITIALPPANDPDGSTRCVMYGDTLREIVSIPGFPERRVKPAQDVVEVREAPGRGLGLFATADIQPGQLLVSERPLLFQPGITATRLESVPTGCSTEELLQIRMYEWEKDLEVAMNMMPSEQRDEYFKLANSHTEDGSGPILGIVRTNCYGTRVNGTYKIGVTFRYSAIGGVTSRINHSCCPNARVNFHTASFSLELRAVRAISAGEEIFVDYCDITAPFKDRKEALAPYGFVCACAACSDPAKSDPIRKACSDAPEPPLDGSITPALAIRAIRALRDAGLQATSEFVSYHSAAMEAFFKRKKVEKGRKYKALASALDVAVHGRPCPSITSGAASKAVSSIIPLPELGRCLISNLSST